MGNAFAISRKPTSDKRVRFDAISRRRLERKPVAGALRSYEIDIDLLALATEIDELPPQLSIKAAEIVKNEGNVRANLSRMDTCFAPSSTTHQRAYI